MVMGLTHMPAGFDHHGGMQICVLKWLGADCVQKSFMAEVVAMRCENNKSVSLCCHVNGVVTTHDYPRKTHLQPTLK